MFAGDYTTGLYRARFGNFYSIRLSRHRYFEIVLFLAKITEIDIWHLQMTTYIHKSQKGLYTDLWGTLF